MHEPVISLPVRSPELIVRRLEDGNYVVKNPSTKDFLLLGEEEVFLLSQLDGRTAATTVLSEFATRFAQTLSIDDLNEFLRLAGEHQLLLATPPARGPGCTATGISQPADSCSTSSTNHLLFWRVNIFDPDRLFSRLVPQIGFVWTPSFLVLSAAIILFGAGLMWTHRHDWIGALQLAGSWESMVFVGTILLLVSVLHEFAHGLTCKRFGGDVHEIGILVMFLIPCFYCNVSDAWFFPQKSKRMLVMFAGIYFDLFLWGLAAMVWWITLPLTLVNQVALIVLNVCGLQSLLNLIPLIQLDGYYLLSDWLEIPNLRQRAMEHCGAQLHWLLWGAERPSREPRGKILQLFGVSCWLFSVGLVAFVLIGSLHFAGPRWGLVGCAGVGFLGLMSTRSFIGGSTVREIGSMVVTRYRRTLAWIVGLVALAMTLCYVKVEDRVHGPFQVRPLSRVELRAPTAGFLKDLCIGEGSLVSTGDAIAQLEIPELASRQEQKRLNIKEVEARLRLLELGARPEEIAEQRQRVTRAKAWRDLAADDMKRDRLALGAELARLDQQINQRYAELTAARESLERVQNLARNRAVSAEQLEEAQSRAAVALAVWEQSQSEKRYRQELGTRETISGPDAKSEFARREREVADAEAVLRLLEAGRRPEEIDAERAHLARLYEESNYMQQLQKQLLIQSPVSGLVTTPRLREKRGQYFDQGDLICAVEDHSLMEVEILLREHDATTVDQGDAIALRARALSSTTILSNVIRLAPSAAPGEVQSTITAYCAIKNASFKLRPGMTGYARIYTGRKPIGRIAVDRAIRFLRTEFWFWLW